VPDSVESSFRPVGRARLVEDVAEVSCNGPDTDDQFFDNLSIGAACRNQASDE